jgi:copper chaperone CopZ
MPEKNIKVQGMTCDHCVNAVTDALNKISGVTGVNIALNTDAPTPVNIVADNDISDADIKSAVEEAGYTIAPA